MSKQELVYESLRERILNGTCGPGYRLVIDRVAGELGVSAQPVREAIRRLEAEGLVVFVPNAGAQVAPTDPSLFESGMTVLAVLEGFATAQAAASMSEDDLAALDATTNEMERSLETLDMLGFGRANQRFHALVYDQLPPGYLVDLLHDTQRRLDAIRRTVFVHIPYRGAHSIAEHRRIVELIRTGAPPDEVEAAARAHKLNTVASFRAWQLEHQDETELAGDAGRRG